MKKIKKILTFISLNIVKNLISFLIFVLMLIAFVSILSVPKAKPLHSNSVLHFIIDRPIVDKVSPNPLDNFNIYNMSPKLKYGLNEILSNIKIAKNDRKIKGIFLEFTGIPISFANVEEIRDALKDFKKSGKFIISYSEYFLHSTYYLASVADEVYQVPTGFMPFFGLYVGRMFFKDGLDKLGIKVNIIRHGKFKSAGEPFMYNKMSKEDRNQLTHFINDLWNKMLSEISEDRGIDNSELKQMADNLEIKSSQDAFEKKLIDEPKYKDEIISLLKTKTSTPEGKKLNSMSLSNYIKLKKGLKKKESKRPKIAVIYALGSIALRGDNDDETQISASRISKAIREARRDSTIKSIVFRINSPGGSALASEVIWREAKLAAQEKPFIASMGSMAASGGYYIAAPADTIVASSSTLTGSIGVFMTAFNIKEFMGNKLGINVDVAKTNRHADIGSPFRVLTPKEQTYFNKSVDEIYNTFLSHVAEGRNLNKENVDSIAQGHIWSGVYAKELGLVDIIGGLDKAIEVAAKKAGLTRYTIVSLPKSKSFILQLIEEYAGGVKQKMVKSELKEYYPYYKKIKDLKNTKGLQARLPYEIDLNMN